MPTGILLVDDHAILRQALKRILESCPDFVVVAEAGSGPEAVELAEKHRPDVALMDIGMKGMNGIEATAQLLLRSPKTAVLMLTVHGSEHYVLRAVNAGARGYLLKDSVEEELMPAIQLARKGERYFSPAVAKYVGAGDPHPAVPTKRERLPG